LVAEAFFGLRLVGLEVLEEVDESFFNFTGIDIGTPNNFSIVDFSSGNFVMSLL